MNYLKRMTRKAKLIYQLNSLNQEIKTQSIKIEYENIIPAPVEIISSNFFIQNPETLKLKDDNQFNGKSTGKILIQETALKLQGSLDSENAEMMYTPPFISAKIQVH